MVNEVSISSGFERNRRRAMLRLLLLVLIIVLLNVVLSRVFFRLDLTQEKRYSLSTPTKELLEE
ncbi:MAG TPA: hypothetical protein PLI89_11660, partial [Chitinophagales bacterium]|nr:hypothetical protein [Chitinophagales bacterium]